MALTPGFEVVGLAIQEAADLSHSDISRRLSDVLKEHPPEGMFCYVVDVFGDAESGDVVFSMGSELRRAPYEIGTVEGKPSAEIDMERAVKVLARTVYEEEADDGDHYTAMEAERAKIYAILPFYERFISKAERSAADAGSFAGKGRSFPILKPGDVMAAVRSMGRAGSANYDTGTLKKRIIAIAKKKGWTKYLPKAWQGGESTEALSEIDVIGDVIPLREGAVGQDGTAVLKLIAPGRGSSGYYPAEVLKRDGPKVFPSGTKNFWDHQTDAEEAARPEGSLRDLASVLTEDAHYEENGPAGPGLYARAKVFEPFRQPVDDLAKHIGMSIRAAGKAREGDAPDGKPGRIIEELTKGISVDYVTTPGAGGKILQLFEAARSAAITTKEREEAEAMDAAELTKLQESIRKQNQRLAQYEARDFAVSQLQTVRLHEATKGRLLSRVLAMAPISADGNLDSDAFKKLIETELAEETEYLSKLSDGRIVSGMNSAPASSQDPRKVAEDFEKEMQTIGQHLGFSESAVKTFATGRERGAA